MGLGMGGSPTKEGYDVPGLGVDWTCRPRVVHRRCPGIHGWLERGWRSAAVASATYQTTIALKQPFAQVKLFDERVRQRQAGR